jgi:hypothetical protein
MKILSLYIYIQSVYIYIHSMDRSEDIMKLLLMQLATTGFCNLRVTLEGGAQGVDKGFVH